MRSSARPPVSPRRRRALPDWLPWLVGFFLLIAAWALAAPYNGTPDEAQHVYRAVGVVTEGAFAREGRWHSVPRSLIRGVCFQFKPTQAAHCSREPGGDTATEPTLVLAGRYNPFYYALVGGPLRLWPNWEGILRARLLSAFLVASLLAAAMHSATRWSRSPFLGAAVFAATTPMTLHLAGAVNPNAPEIAAGTAFFAALIPLLLEPEATPRRAQLWVVGIAGSLLAVLRAFGPLWVAIALGVLMVPPFRAQMARVFRHRGLWVCLGLVLLAVAAGVAWSVMARTGTPDKVSIPAGFTSLQAVRYVITSRLGSLANEMVGVLSWLDTTLPPWFYLAWWSLLGLFTLSAATFGGGIDRWRIAVLLLAVFGIPGILETILVRTYGFASQGRYVLPIAVGIPMVSAFTLSARNIFPAQWATGLTRAVAMLCLPLHLFALGFTMIRWQSGIPSTLKALSGNPLEGRWHPPMGSVLPMGLALAGAIVLGVRIWRTSAPAPSADQAAE